MKEHEISFRQLDAKFLEKVGTASPQLLTLPDKILHQLSYGHLDLTDEPFRKKVSGGTKI